MLQRIQSVFLFLAALCASATWFFPVRTWTNKVCLAFMTHGLHHCDGADVVDAGLPVPFHVLHSVIALVLLVCIFLFSNRPRQARVVRAVWLVALLVGVLQFISCNSIDTWIRERTIGGGAYGVSFFLPIGTVLFAILAERAIKKDEALVRSADRLR